MSDRLDVIEKVLQQDGFAPETLDALVLILEELRYLRAEIGGIRMAPNFFSY
jgi:hypothetical protein